MTSLEKHDYEIKCTLERINIAVNKGYWRAVADQTKYLLRLVKDRNEFSRIKKLSKTINDCKITRF